MNYEHSCKKLESENRNRRRTLENQIYIFKDVCDEKWYTKVGNEYVPSEFCPFCGEKLDG